MRSADMKDFTQGGDGVEMANVTDNSQKPIIDNKVV